MQKIPVYQIDMDSPEHGLKKVSFVENPAMETDFIALASEGIKLAKDEKKQILTGALIIPDKKIIRVDASENPYYIVFTKEQIENSRNKFFKESRIGLTNFEHDYDLEGNYVIESWIVSNSELDKSVAIGLGSFPEGTLMISYKVEDSKFWEEQVMSGNVKGFSLEGLFSLNEVKLKKDKMSKPNALKTILSNIKSTFGISLSEMTLEDGATIFQDEDSGNVYSVNEDGSQGDLLPDGDYVLEGGETITIVEGKISVEDGGENELEEVKSELEEAKKKIAELEEAKSDLETEKTELSKENFEAKFSEEISNKDSKIKELETELSEAKTKIVELGKESASKGVEDKGSEKPSKPMTTIERALAVSV